MQTITIIHVTHFFCYILKLIYMYLYIIVDVLIYFLYYVPTDICDQKSHGWYKVKQHVEKLFLIKIKIIYQFLAQLIWFFYQKL